MQFIKNTFGFIFVVVNLLVGVGLLGGAYAQYLSPILSPILSVAGLIFPIFAMLNLLFVLFWLVVHPKFVVLPLFLYLCCIDPLLTYSPMSMSRSSNGGKVLKVLTYNTMGIPGEKNSKGKMIYPAVDYIKKSGADIVCLQEFPAEHKEIVRQLKSVYPYIKIVTFHSSLRVACVSKTPILSSESIDLISTGNGSALFYVKLDEKGKQKIPVIINHLESNKLSGSDKEIYESMLEDPQNRFVKNGSKYLLFKLADAASLRCPQANTIAQRIREINSPHIIVCGDFNDTPLSYTHRVIGEGLQDTYREVSFGPDMTYHEHFMYFRIDHMFVGQGYRVLDCEVDKSIDASDHYPYWSTIEILPTEEEVE